MCTRKPLEDTEAAAVGVEKQERQKSSFTVINALLLTFAAQNTESTILSSFGPTESFTKPSREERRYTDTAADGAITHQFSPTHQQNGKCAWKPQVTMVELSTATNCKWYPQHNFRTISPFGKSLHTAVANNGI